MKKILLFVARQPFLHNLSFAFSELLAYPKVIQQYMKIKKTEGRFALDFLDLFPIIDNSAKSHEFDAHYIYHPAWAARILSRTKPKVHYDFSSFLSFSTILSAFIPVKFYDFRILNLKLSDLSCLSEDLTKLSFKNNSLESVSCMHVIEHIGLGRYGDNLDSDGDIKAIRELQRVVKKNGNILFVTPIGGKPKIIFNAHRIYTYNMISNYFKDFTLKEFSLVTDGGIFITNATEKQANQQKYGCGCFWYEKK